MVCFKRRESQLTLVKSELHISLRRAGPVIPASTFSESQSWICVEARIFFMSSREIGLWCLCFQYNSTLCKLLSFLLWMKNLAGHSHFVAGSCFLVLTGDCVSGSPVTSVATIVFFTELLTVVVTVCFDVTFLLRISMVLSFVTVVLTNRCTPGLRTTAVLVHLRGGPAHGQWYHQILLWCEGRPGLGESSVKFKVLLSITLSTVAGNGAAHCGN